jgi:co-chaperonin GroES (HSP10)
MLTAAYNDVFVKVKYTSQKSKTAIAIAASMEHNSTVNLMDYITITGEVVSIPKKIDTGEHDNGYSTKDIQIGDTAIFSYYVVGDLSVKDDNHYHKNLVFYQGQQLFKASIDNIFGVIRNGEIIMINGYVMIEDFKASKLILPSYLKCLISASKSKLLYIGSPKENEEPITAKQNDTVYFNPFIVQRYNIGDKKFCIIRQDQILGVEL